MTEYNWKLFVNDETSFVKYSFKRVGTVIALATILTGSNIEFPDEGHFKPVSEVMEYDVLEHVECINFHMTDETKDYIASKPKLKELLDTIEKKIPAFFTSNEVWVDLIQSSGQEQPTVSVNIASTLSLEKALQELSSFDDCWWLSCNAEAKELVNVDVITS